LIEGNALTIRRHP